MADIDENQEGESRPAGAKQSPKSARGNMLVIVVGLLVMIIAPAASYLVVRTTVSTKGSEPAAEEPNILPTPPMVQIESLVVNISGTRMTRVLRFQPHLVLSDVRLKDYLPEIMPMVKDRIMTTAGSRTLEQLESAEDRDALKRDIATEINGLVRDKMLGTVLDVVFSDFLIQ